MTYPPDAVYVGCKTVRGQARESLQRYPWTTLAAMKGDQQIIRKLEETEKLIKDQRAKEGSFQMTKATLQGQASEQVA